MISSKLCERFVIVSDEGDWSWTGHNHFYSVSVAAASAADGRETVILAPISATGEVGGNFFETIPYIVPQRQLIGGRQVMRKLALRVLPRNSPPKLLAAARLLLEVGVSLRMRLKKATQTGKAARPLDGTFGFQIAAAIIDGLLRPTDILFVHTILTQSLESLLFALEGVPTHLLPKIRLTLRTDPDEIATRYGRQLELKEILARFWQTEQLRNRIAFLTDTEELKADYERLSPFRLSVIPIPVDVPARAPKGDETPLTLTYVGAIRRERGFPLLPKLARYLAAQNYSRPIKLVVQAGGMSLTEDPHVKSMIDELRKFPNLVSLVIGSLPPEGYTRLLHDADIILLPYDAHRYRSRSSGVLAEAIKLGCPTVVPENTWMARMAGHSAVTFSANDREEAFARAVDGAIKRFSALRAEAAALSENWERNSTPEAVYQAVLLS